MSTDEFKDKVAIVTGAGSGIGRSCAIAFAEEGAKVVVADMHEKEGCGTVGMIEEKGGEALFVRCDVANGRDVEAMVRSTVERFGRLDYACNNAGIEGKSAPTAEYDEAVWRRVIDVNLTGVWLCMKYQIPEMLKQGEGAIVNVASILGVVGFANAAAYTAAKHGVLGLTKAAAIEYATQGIRVNAVCPAFIYTPMLERAGMVRGSQAYDAITALHPMKRMGTPEEIASSVVWLCSDAASFVTGHSMLVDGGYVAQ
jgi:NAD(P)-dependent dehydrogenase (short-subunit alcohol dehydrogenase family)